MISLKLGVKGFYDLKTRKMGDMILVDVHMEFDANSTVQAGYEIV
jgi:divalent metal cation (Fe/Co/Zn/Cd) transporter